MKSEEVSDVGKLVASIAQRYVGIKSAYHGNFHEEKYYEEAGATKQVHLPHSIETGLDCSAMVNLVIADAFRELGSQTTIPRHVKEFFRWQAAVLINPDNLPVGTLLFVHASQKRTPPSHIGIYVGDDKVIHSPGNETGHVKKICINRFVEGCIPMSGYGLFAAKILSVK